MVILFSLFNVLHKGSIGGRGPITWLTSSFLLFAVPSFTSTVNFGTTFDHFFFIGENVTYGGCQLQTRFIYQLNISLWQNNQRITAYTNTSLYTTWNGDSFDISTPFEYANHAGTSFEGHFYCRIDYMYGNTLLNVTSDLVLVDVRSK